MKHSVGDESKRDGDLPLALVFSELEYWNAPVGSRGFERGIDDLDGVMLSREAPGLNDSQVLLL